MSNQDKAIKPSTDGVATASNQTPAAIDGNTGKLERLLELLLSRENTNLEKEAADKQRYAALSAQREKNQSQNARNLLRLQAKCKHIKGLGKRTGKHEAQYANRVDDPSVMMHVFVDGSAVIKCLQCGAKWKKDDTAEFLVRNGKKFPNVTKIGWTEALGLVAKSSNTMTSSEVPASQFSRQQAEELVVPDGFEF